MPKRTFKVDNDIFDIEDTDVADFLKEAPNAKEVKSFIVDRDTFDIEIPDVEEFLRQAPNAKPIFEAEKKKFGLEDFNKKYGTSYTPQQFGGKNISQSPLKSSSTTTTTPLPKTAKQEVKSLADFNKKYNTQYTPAQIQGKEPLKIEPQDESFANELFQSAQRGSAMLGSMLANTPSFIYDIAAYPQNKLAELTGLPIGTSSEQIAQTLGLPENEIANYYEQIVKDGQAKVQQKYDKGVTEYLFGEKPDYKKGFKLLANQVVESAPISLSLMMGNAAGVGAVGSTIGGGVVFGAGNMQELEGANMSETAKVENALSKGLFEGLFEQFGVTKLGGVVGDVFKKQGAEAAANIAKEGFRDVYLPVLKKYVGIGAEESIGEAATQFSQNMVTILSGENPNLNPMEGVSDAALVGLGSSTAYSSPAAVFETLSLSKNRKEVKEKQAKLQKIEETIANPETAPETKAVLTEMSKSINESITDSYEEAKPLYDALPEESKQELVETLAKQDELEVAVNDPTLAPEIKEEIVIQIDELETKINDIVKTAEQIALEKLEAAKRKLDESTAKKENEESLPSGVSGIRTESEIGQESTELRTEIQQEEVDEPTISEGDIPKGDKGVEVAEPTIQKGEGQVEIEKETKEQANPVLKDVESTAKALEGVDVNKVLQIKYPRKAIPTHELIAVEHAGYEAPRRVTSANKNEIQVQGYGTLPTTSFLSRLIEKGRLNRSDFKKGLNIRITEEYATKLLRENEDLFPSDLAETKTISEAYHKAKADGSNPELVKAVEALLGTESTRTENVSKKEPKIDTKVESTLEEQSKSENKVEPTAEKALDSKKEPNKVVEKTLEGEKPKKTFTKEDLSESGFEIVQEVKGKGVGGALSLKQQQDLESEIGSLEGLSFFALDNGNVAVVRKSEEVTPAAENVFDELDLISPELKDAFNEIRNKKPLKSKAKPKDTKFAEALDFLKEKNNVAYQLVKSVYYRAKIEPFFNEIGKEILKSDKSTESVAEILQKYIKKSEGVTSESSTPTKDYFSKRIESINAKKSYKDISELEVGDAVITSRGSIGFVKKINPKKVILETTYGGYADSDSELMEISVNKDEIKEFKKPKEISKSDIISKLENAKIKGKTFDAILGIPVAIYNTALETMILALKANKKINEAIKAGYEIVKDYVSESDFRKHLVENDYVPSEFAEVPAEPEPKSPLRKLSKHFTTIQNNKSLESTVKDLKESDYEYDVVSRQSNVDVAVNYVAENGLEETLNEFKGKDGKIAGLTEAQRVAVGEVLYRALHSARREALQNNDIDLADYIQNEMAQVTSTLQKFGTSLGQGVSQMARFALDFSDPLTAVFNMQKHLEVINNEKKESAAVKSNSKGIAKEINNTVEKGKKKVVKEVVKTVNEELYGVITMGKKGLTDTQKQKVKNIFNAFKVNPNGGPVQSSLLPIKEVIAAVITPEKYNKFIDKVADLVAEGLSLSVAMTKVSAEFIKDKIANPKEMEVARKRLSEQVKGLKETKPLTEKQKEAKAAREELKEATKEYETLVNELVSEYLQLSPEQKTTNKKLIEMVMDKLGVDERSAKVIATKIAEGVAKNIKKKLENKFANQLSAEERAAKAKGIKPKANPLDEIIAAADTGITPELVQEYFKNKYGIESLSVQEVESIQELAKKVSDAPTANRKGVLLGEIQRMIDSKRNKTLAELFQSLWYARVLSPVLFLIPVGTGDTNITYNLITLMSQALEFPIVSALNLATNLKKVISKEKPKTKGELLKTITGSLQDFSLGLFNAIGQNVIYNESEQKNINKFLSILTQTKYLSQSINYFRTSITDGLDFKKDYDNPFKATAGGRFDLANWNSTFKKAENGDKSAQAKIANAVRAIVNGYVNGVTNVLGGQDLFFGSIIGNLYKPALLREKYMQEGFEGEKLNKKIAEDILNTKLEYENARQKAIDFRIKYDITIEPKLTPTDIKYEVKDNGRLKETFDNKEDAETYARDVLAPKGNDFRNDVNYLLNQKIGELVNSNAERISRNLLLSGDVEGGTRYLMNFANNISKVFSEISKFFNDLSEQVDLYDALDIKNMALGLDKKTFEAILRKSIGTVLKAISVTVKALENLVAFMRVGLNAVRMASNYLTPIGIARYIMSFITVDDKSMGFLGKMSYKMTNTERNQILAKAIVGGLTFQFAAIVKSAIENSLKGDDEEEKEELTKEKKESERLFKEWYKSVTGEEITKEINTFYSKLTEGQVIGSLSWMTPDRKRFYERTGLLVEYSRFEGFNEQGKPKFSTVKNRPTQAMNIMVSTYQLIEAFGDDKDKENINLYTAMTPLYSWKDMSIGQGGVSMFFGQMKPDEIAKKVAQIAVLDNFEILNPRAITVGLQYFDQKMRRTPTLFESLEQEATMAGGFKEWMLNRVIPVYGAVNQATKAQQLYGMLGEELYRIPNESQGMFSNMLAEYVKSGKNIEEQKMYMWLDINGYDKIWKPKKEEPIIVDGEAKLLTDVQINKYGRIAGRKTFEELKSKLKDLQEIRQVGEEDAATEQKRINNFKSEIDEIFKKNFNNAFYEGEKTFGADTEKFLAKKDKLFDESFKLKVERVKNKDKKISALDTEFKTTDEEKEDRAMNKSIDQYLSEMKDLNDDNKLKKLERLLYIGSISRDEFIVALRLINEE